MNEDALSHLRDLQLRRELTPEEAKQLAEYLSRRPDLAGGWAEDAALAAGLRRLPQAHVPSNFTSLVLSEVRRESAVTRSRPRVQRFWSPVRFWWSAATATLLIVGGGLTWHYQQVRQRDYIQSLAALRALSEIPPDVLQDFEAIRRYGESSPPIDFELLAALQ